jgi:hypothetical protein
MPQSNINDWGGPNSPVRRAHERLLRKLLRYDNRPAVLELVFFRYPGPNWILDEAQTKRGSFYRCEAARRPQLAVAGAAGAGAGQQRAGASRRALSRPAARLPLNAAV